MELEEGILLKYKALRQKQLGNAISENCFGDPKLKIWEAEQCEKFHYENDYKLKNLSSFWKDHIPKHIRGYQGCVKGLD